MEDIKKAECGNCFFRTLKSTNLKEVMCRRHPPTPVVLGMTKNGPMVAAMFPTVEREWFCGEFRPEILHG